MYTALGLRGGSELAFDLGAEHNQDGMLIVYDDQRARPRRGRRRPERPHSDRRRDGTGGDRGEHDQQQFPTTSATPPPASRCLRSRPQGRKKSTLGGSRQANTHRWRGHRFELVLGGGGALGAFQAGVYEASKRLDMSRIGSSVRRSALNAALIAGNPPRAAAGAPARLLGSRSAACPARFHLGRWPGKVWMRSAAAQFT